LAVDSRLALGTAQFGLPYGIANHTGRISGAEAATILSAAWTAGVDTLDTAVAYGDSESRLGEIGVAQWRVISKLPADTPSEADVAAWARQAVLQSLARLRIASLQGILLHRSEQLFAPGGEKLYRALVALREEGYVGKVGVSIYDPSELEKLWPRFKLDLVQAPFNVLDRRLETAGWLARLHGAGTEIHVRSVFLQGLLLMGQAVRPAMFGRWRPIWQQWHHWLEETGLSPLQTCLNFVLARAEIDRVVLGVDSSAQLAEILAGVRAATADAPLELMSDDADLINPSRWKLQ
jgi:aryl-alcohol dehydrogenase-like predicted oxidoreductase